MADLMTAPVMARATDPITSDLAAEKLKQSGVLNRMQSIVLDLFAEFGAMNDTALDVRYADLASARGYPSARFDSPRKRRSELSSRGFLVNTGERVRNAFGSTEFVWAVA